MADNYAAWDQFFSMERRAREYEGLTREQAEERARRHCITDLRVADWDQPTQAMFTADLRPQRLNLLIHHHRVARAAFG